MKPITTAKITMFFESAAAPAQMVRGDAKADAPQLNAPIMTRADTSSTPATTSRQLRDRYLEGESDDAPLQDIMPKSSIITIASTTSSCCNPCCMFRK